MNDTAAIADLRARVAKLERALASLQQHLGVQYVDEANGSVPQEVVLLVRAGDKMGAIKRHRELTGSSLQQAKDAVEGVE